MINTAVRFTYEDYKNLPDSETRRCEVIEGELFMVPAPTTHHQRVLLNLASVLMNFVQKHGLGDIYVAPCDVVLSEENVVQPDIIFISKEHSHIIREENIRGTPDLVIEIFSPSSIERDRTAKKKIYAKYGIREYWLVNPKEETLEVMGPGKKGLLAAELYKVSAGKTIINSAMFPGLALHLHEIFAR